MRSKWIIGAVVVSAVFFILLSNPGVKARYAARNIVKQQHSTSKKRNRERDLTDEEQQRCSAEINRLEDMKVQFAIATTITDVSLAVMASRDLVSNNLLDHGQWEHHETVTSIKAYEAAMQQQAKGTCAQPPCVDKVFLDVGVNLGSWTFYAAQEGYHTVSVEGSPPNFALLQLSKCLNPVLAPRINLVESFVNEGSEHCLVVCDLANQGDVSLNCKAEEWTEPAMTAYKAEFTKHNRNVRLTRTMTRKLDDVIAEALAAHPNFPNVFHGVKIDIEGSELMAMRGAPKLLAGQGAAELPIIFSEVWYHIRGGPHPDAYFQLMRAAGYELRDPTCQHVWPAEQDAEAVTRLSTTNIENVCFMKQRLPATVAVVPLTPPPTLPPALPRPRHPLRRHERYITDEELQRCNVEIAALDALKIDFAIAKMVTGASLAVMRGSDIVSGMLLSSGTWEHSETVKAFQAYDRLMQQKAKGTCAQPPCVDKVFLDIGTNLGTWSFYAALQGMHTVSVEGSPPNFALLQLSKCLNPLLAPRINLIHAFVSEGSEYCLIMCDLSNQGDIMLNCQDHEWTEPELTAHREMLRVKEGRKNVLLTRTMTRRLDDVVAEALAAHPNFPNVFHGMKIDIESSELMAMRGSPKLLGGQGAAELPVIFSEVWWEIRGGPHPDAYFQLMRAHGYDLRDPTCQHAWPATQDAAVVARLGRTRMENLCFVKLGVAATTPLVPAPVVPVPVPIPPPVPVPTPRIHLQRHERLLTDEERQTCSAEIAALDELKITYAIAKMTTGVSLAVIRGSDIVSGVLLTSGLWENAEMIQAFQAYNRIMQHNPNGTCAQPPCVDKVFLDVGANLGTWTVYAALHGYHTVSVEGSPPNFALLQLSKCLNPLLAPRINLIHAFVSEGSEHCLIMCDLSNQGDIMLNCQDHEWTEPEMVVHREMLRVKEGRRNVLLKPTVTRRLDDVIAEALAAHPNFPNVFHGMKIDIESSELMAMRGSPKLLGGQGAAELPVIFSEVWYQIRGGPHPDAYFQLMRAHGYELRDTTCQNVSPAEQDRAAVARIQRHRIENVCFVKSKPVP